MFKSEFSENNKNIHYCNFKVIYPEENLLEKINVPQARQQNFINSF